MNQSTAAVTDTMKDDSTAVHQDRAIRASLTGRDEPWWIRIGRWQRMALIAIEFVVIAFVWEVAIGRFELISPIFLPPPSRIFEGLIDLFASGEIYPHLSISAHAWSVGYAAAASVGIIGGFLLGSSVAFARLGGPIIWLIYAAPWIAFQPLFVVWFGFGLRPVIFIVFTASVFAVLFNTAAGVQTVDPSLLRCASVFGARTLQRYRTVVFPAVFPFILVGLRHAVVIATVGLLVGELTSTTRGLGALVAIKTAQFRIGSAFAVILLAVIFTTVVGQSVAALARRFAPWHFVEDGR
jgi:ABC-type nitrate/sulfonate/bicarbonate transport system permease component